VGRNGRGGGVCANSPTIRDGDDWEEHDLEVRGSGRCRCGRGSVSL